MTFFSLSLVKEVQLEMVQFKFESCCSRGDEMQHGKVLCQNEFGAPSAFAEHSSYQTEVLTDESEQETLT